MSVLQTGVSARKCWVPTNNTQWTHHQLTVQTRQTRSVWEYTLTSPFREGRPWRSWPSARGQHVRERRKTLGWDKEKNLCVPQREVEKPRQEHSRKLGSMWSDSFLCHNHVPESWNANHVSIITSNCILNISTKYPTITSNSTHPKQDFIFMHLLLVLYSVSRLTGTTIHLAGVVGSALHSPSWCPVSPLASTSFTSLTSVPFSISVSIPPSLRQVSLWFLLFHAGVDG